mmetsp:Transcript_57271/g.186206  ORF Transcript_57271/g.186206 Transcript_57271/m.186206 type:complete len:349 (+) Transcript_57271:2585-3631(+)
MLCCLPAALPPDLVLDASSNATEAGSCGGVRPRRHGKWVLSASSDKPRVTFQVTFSNSSSSATPLVKLPLRKSRLSCTKYSYSFQRSPRRVKVQRYAAGMTAQSKFEPCRRFDKLYLLSPCGGPLIHQLPPNEYNGTKTMPQKTESAQNRPHIAQKRSMTKASIPAHSKMTDSSRESTTRINSAVRQRTCRLKTCFAHRLLARRSKPAAKAAEILRLRSPACNSFGADTVATIDADAAAGDVGGDVEWLSRPKSGSDSNFSGLISPFDEAQVPRDSDRRMDVRRLCGTSKRARLHCFFCASRLATSRGTAMHRPDLLRSKISKVRIASKKNEMEAKSVTLTERTESSW